MVQATLRLPGACPHRLKAEEGLAALGKFGVDVIGTMLDDNDDTFAVKAARLLARMGWVAVPVLVRLSRSGISNLRQAAEEGLTSICNPRRWDL